MKWPRLPRARAPALPMMAAAMLLAAGLAWLSWPPESAVEDIVLADASQPAFALVYVADAKGFFRHERLRVRFRSFTLGRDALASAIAGDSDIATVFETPTAIRLHEKQPLAIVTMLHTSTDSHALVARRDRGIATAADLRGKRIGATPGTSTEYFAFAFLAAHGIPLAAVTLVPVEPAGYAAALGTGAVDALATFNPHPFTLERTLGRDRLEVFRSEVFVEASLLVGTRARLRQKEEATRRLVRALARAERHIAAHREESLLIVAERLMTTHPEFAVKRGWGAIRPRLGLDNVLLATLANESEWLRSTGRYRGPPPDLEDAMAPQFLEDAKPDSVTILRRPGPR